MEINNQQLRFPKYARDGEPETVKPKNRFLASAKIQKTGSWTEPVFQSRTGTGSFFLNILLKI